MAFQQFAQRSGCALRALCRRFARFAQVGVGRGCEQRFRQQWRIYAAIQRNVADRERADRLAVIAILQRDELGAAHLAAVAEPMESHLQRDFHAGRTIVGIEHLGQWLATDLPGRDRQQTLGQLHRRGMRTTRQDDVLQRRGLSGDGRRDTRFGVTEQVGPPAADCIKVAAAIAADQPGAFAARDRQQRQRVRVLAHLCARMPEHCQVARTPCVGVRYHRRIVSLVLHPSIIAASGAAAIGSAAAGAAP